MYVHQPWDRALLRERVAQFRDQTARYLSGELTEEDYRPLRLMNGVYVQRHAPMLRVGIPYGLLDAEQLRALAAIATDFDRGYGHFTTRQNIQFNWIPLADMPQVLERLAAVGLHAIQTSGNCIRNVTSDPLAGLTTDEIADPLPWCEVVRQWATLHPEFSYLPRKFKIAITGHPADRALIRVHDVGLRLARDSDEGLGFCVAVGGGLGREPHLGKPLRCFLPADELLNYLNAILRVYNRHGRRDKPYKSRIKILVKTLGIDAFRDQVEAEWQRLRTEHPVSALAALERVSDHFSHPSLAEDVPNAAPCPPTAVDGDNFNRWLTNNTHHHLRAGHRAVYLFLKGPEREPGDLDADEMRRVAELADRFSHGRLRTTQRQNLLLPHVHEDDLYALWHALRPLGLARPAIDRVEDTIACPGADFCALANAPTLAPARALRERLGGLDRRHDLGPLRMNISGCMNACGHHHVGHIGLLGVDKRGEPHFQITVGGDDGAVTRFGRVLGPALPVDVVDEALERLLHTHLCHRLPGEEFNDTLARLGPEPFKEALYARDHV